MAEPIFIATRYLPDIWTDGVQHVEELDGARRRIIFYRDRITTDGVRYREPVAALLCSTKAEMPCCLGQNALTGKNVN